MAVFYAGVSMVNIKDANVINATLDTFATQRGDDFSFPFPVSRLFPEAIIIFIPILLLALFGAIPRWGWPTTHLAFSVNSPPVLLITFTRAKLCFAKAGRRHIKFLPAVLAGYHSDVFGAIGRYIFQSLIPGRAWSPGIASHRTVNFVFPSVKRFAANGTLMHNFFHGDTIAHISDSVN